MVVEPEGIDANVDPETEFAATSVSDVVIEEATGIRANEFEENDSDSEPSKSISAAFTVAGAADQREERRVNFYNMEKSASFNTWILYN